MSQEIDKLKKVLNSGGATIFGQLSDSVSHVIVGEFNANDAKILAKCNQRLVFLCKFLFCLRA